jgi:GT2 family glycosyltransferase
MTISVVVPTLKGGPRLDRLLQSLRAQTVDHETLVVNNGLSLELDHVFPEADVLDLRANLGFSRAVNLGAHHVGGDVLVLLNDDVVCEPTFLEELAGALAPARGVVMAAAVLLTPDEPWLIDSAGMQLDTTLLPFDFLNGEPVVALEDAPDPIGPSAAAAAFNRELFLTVGGFDERLFAYWEDVDLVLRLRRLGARCALAREAFGTHEHSATLGSGSREKNYLMGFGRSYVLRKWSVLTPRRLAKVLLHDATVCVGQAVLDHNAVGIRGRLDGYRAAREVASLPYPNEALASAPHAAAGTLARRARRRARLSRRRETARA